MSEEKQKLLNLPSEILKEIFAYLTPETLFYPMMKVCKTFNEIASDPLVMTISFFSTIKVPMRYGGFEFSCLDLHERSSIIRNVFWDNGTSEKISVIPYYTDGGVYDSDSRYFISNIYSQESNELYSSTRGENVNVKALVTSSLSPHIDLQNISKYKISNKSKMSNKHHQYYPYPNDTYLLPVKKLMYQYDPQNFKQFGILKFHDLNRNVLNYTCYLQSFVVFISMEEIDTNHPLIKLFDGVKKIDQVDKLGFEYTMLESMNDTHVVEFVLHPLHNVERNLQKKVPGAKLNGVYPFLWGDISKDNNNYLNIVQRIGFRFMLLKLIDSHKTLTDSNIDCYSIGLSGSLIKLKSTYEE